MLASNCLLSSINSKDPKRFYNHDLINLLQHHEPIADDEFALSTLAACSSSTHVRKRQIRRLLDIASGEISNIGRNHVSIVTASKYRLSFHLHICRHNGVSSACFTMHHH